MVERLAVAMNDPPRPVLSYQLMNTNRQTIVAEISKSWPDRDKAPIISKQFEQVVEVNRARGYTLRDWRFTAVTDGGEMIETIIAVFDLNKTEQ